MMEYELMHKDVPCANLMIDEDGTITSITSIRNRDHLPIGTTDRAGGPDPIGLRGWWKGRSIPINRPGLRGFLQDVGMDIGSIATESLGLGLSDQYWVRPSTDTICWDDVNFFDNPFSPDVGDLLFGRAVTGGTDLSSPDITTDGILMKRWVTVDEDRYLMKSGRETYNQEPFNEVIASIIMDSQGIPNARYELVIEDGKVCSICKDFITGDTELVPASRLLHDVDIRDPSRYRDGYEKICEELGMDVFTSLSMMDLIDHIMINTDRHPGNYGLIRDANTLEWIGPAPIFDTGTSLMCKAQTDRIRNGMDHVNDDLHMNNRLFHADLDWLDLDAMFSTIPRIEELLYSNVVEDGTGVDTERAEALVDLIVIRMEGIEDMLL